MGKEYQPPKDAHKLQAAASGHQKSNLAQARFCKEPVTLPPAPWEKEEEQ